MPKMRALPWIAAGVAVLIATTARADDAVGPVSPAADGFLDAWQARVQQAQSSQPHWITPLATVTPRLEQEIRYDQVREQLGNGQHLDNFDGGKGLELIPTTTNEVILNAPPFYDRTYSRTQSQIGTGFADTPVLVVKQRLLSSPESAGNYILTAFLGVTAPTAATRFTPHDDPWSLTPTIAGGLGWRDFDVQSTLGVQIPVSYPGQNGKTVQSNTAFQYHFGTYFWPEVEVNETYWTGGPRGGKFQTMFTPGIIFGRFALADHTNAILGVGYQFAATPVLTTSPVITPLYDRALLLTARVTF